MGQPSDAKTAFTNQEDAKKGWVEVRDATDPSFGEVVIQNVALSCSLGEFFDTFLRDGALRSLDAFQRDVIGDTELDVSSWVLADDGSSFKRTIKYRHPVNAPVGPPSALAAKEQTMRRFAGFGICLDTRTIVTGVPVADCFHVDDRVLVEPAPEGGVSLQAKFEVRFIKRTMFKNIVKSTTTTEVRGFFEKYTAYLKEAIQAGILPADPLLSPLDFLLCGMDQCMDETIFKNPLKDLEERFENTFSCWEQGIANLEESFGNHAVATTAVATTERVIPAETTPTTGVELVYLNGLARELSRDPLTCKLSKKQLVQSAMSSTTTTESEWESLTDGIYAQQISNQEEKEELLGYSVFEDEGVVAAFLENNAGHRRGRNLEKSLSIEVAAF